MKITKPRLPVKLEESDSWALVPEAEIEKVHIDGGELEGRVLPALNIDEVRLERVNLSAGTLERLLVRDSIFQACDLSGVRSPEASLQRVSVTAGRMTGWDVSRGQLHDISFSGCKLNLANFRYARLHNVEFVDCILSGADFIQAMLHNVRFKQCQLDGTEFNHSMLKHADFRGCDVTGLKGWQHMRGAVLDHDQLLAIAPQLAADLGIRVED